MVLANELRQFPVLVIIVFWSAMTLNQLAADDPPSAVGAMVKLYQSGRLPVERRPPSHGQVQQLSWSL